jgi:hypothetical protein
MKSVETFGRCSGDHICDHSSSEPSMASIKCEPISRFLRDAQAWHRMARNTVDSLQNMHTMQKVSLAEVVETLDFTRFS